LKASRLCSTVCVCFIAISAALAKSSMKSIKYLGPGLSSSTERAKVS
jgi:hypothetical protein